jgi:outer membrane protein
MIALVALLALQDTSRLPLEDAVRAALAAHPSVALARAAGSRAGADLSEARSARLPRLVLEASATRFQEPMLAYPLHGFPTGLPAPGSPDLPTFDRTLLQGSAHVQWTVWDFGERAGRVRAADHLTAAADAGLTEAEQTLAHRTALAYLRVLTTAGLLAAHDQRLAALTAEVDRIRRLLAEGRAARIEELRVETERARGEAERIAAATQLEVAEREVAQLTGLGVASVRAARLLSVRLRPGLPPLESREVLIARAADANPDVVAARRRADAARSAAEAVRASRMPEVRLGAGLVDRGRASGAFQAEWQAGLSLHYALWTGGARSSLIRRADADASGAAEQVRLAEQASALEVERAVAAAREAAARAAALRRAVRQSEEVVRIERTALEIGSGQGTDYLDAEAGLLGARAGLLEAEHAEIAARITLLRLTGTLSPAALTALLEPAR